MDVSQKSPRIFCNSRFGPSPRVSVDCGFYLRVWEGPFCKTVTDASPGRRIAGGRRGSLGTVATVDAQCVLFQEQYASAEEARIRLALI